jgi:hypothetical protein
MSWLVFYNLCKPNTCLNWTNSSVPKGFGLDRFYCTTKVVSSNPSHGEVYLIQHYVIKLVSDLRQVDGFLQVTIFFLHPWITTILTISRRWWVCTISKSPPLSRPTGYRTMGPFVPLTPPSMDWHYNINHMTFFCVFFFTFVSMGQLFEGLYFICRKKFRSV